MRLALAAALLLVSASDAGAGGVRFDGGVEGFVGRLVHPPPNLADARTTFGARGVIGVGVSLPHCLVVRGGVSFDEPFDHAEAAGVAVGLDGAIANGWRIGGRAVLTRELEQYGGTIAVVGPVVRDGALAVSAGAVAIWNRRDHAYGWQLSVGIGGASRHPIGAALVAIGIFVARAVI